MSERSKRLVVDSKENICKPHSQAQTRAQTAEREEWQSMREVSREGRILTNVRTHQCLPTPQSIYRTCGCLTLSQSQISRALTGLKCGSLHYAQLSVTLNSLSHSSASAHPALSQAHPSAWRCVASTASSQKRIRKIPSKSGLLIKSGVVLESESGVLVIIVVVSDYVYAAGKHQ